LKDVIKQQPQENITTSRAGRPKGNVGNIK
jgi:hypothetical protein